jgi:hypothetical protein
MESPPEFNAAGSRLARYRPAVYALVIFLLNIYVARELLSAEFAAFLIRMPTRRFFL